MYMPVCEFTKPGSHLICFFLLDFGVRCSVGANLLGEQILFLLEIELYIKSDSIDYCVRESRRQCSCSGLQLRLIKH